jgi:hypothetical protein
MIWEYRTSTVCDYFCSVVWIFNSFSKYGGRRNCPVGWQQWSEGLYVFHLLVFVKELRIKCSSWLNAAAPVYLVYRIFETQCLT